MTSTSPESFSNSLEPLCGLSTLPEKGWAILDHFIAKDRCHALKQEIERLCIERSMRPAGIGRRDGRRVIDEIRGDSIFWLDRFQLNAATEPAWRALESLQYELNRSFFLGLRHFEAHLTHYSPGSFYQKHKDRFEEDDARSVSAILYLNEDWCSGDGGALRLYCEEGFEDIAPLAGRLVLLVSQDIYHEVLTPNRDRLSLTAWFRTDDGF